ncbi:MAG: nitroreductase family protein [Flavobacteriales bacterium CG_4_10_14_0_2_um_filter_32_8]|nr:MAG: nitroreductase family protein [Flavobacteriales bacterium CG_4_10_14_0_2_um_filter_32_8]PJB15297.1 MAG: nitroreductase family protein [Flavobacteriales bacterium CG_4_9_14_3_um_filter_32_8]
MTHKFIPYRQKELTIEEQLTNSETFYQFLAKRRSVREFSSQPIDMKIIENIIKAASTSPSGAHKQPWTFCVVSNLEIKKQIRIAAETEEKENYESRMSNRWKEDLLPFATNWEKPFLEEAPYLIVVFKRVYELVEGEKQNNYYVNESVGIATGMLITAIHNAGLVALTHTPSPMNFLTNVLTRPENERPFLLLPVGFALKNTQVPDLQRKTLEEIIVRYE